MSDDVFYARLFAIVLLAALGAAVIALMRPFAGPMAWAMLLAFVLHPVNLRLRQSFRDRGWLASLVLTLGVMLGITIPAVAITAAFVKEAAELIKRLSQAGGFESLGQHPAVVRISEWLDAHFSISMEGLRAFVDKNVSGLAGKALAQGEAIFVGVMGAGASIAIMLFILFFALRGGDQVAGRLIRILPLREDHKQSLVTQMSAVTRATVLGALVVSLAQGLLVGVAFLIVGLPSPVVFGVLASLASLLPIGGTALVWGPGAIALLIQARWGAALFLALWGVLVVSVADNILRPRFISGRAQVPTLGVLLGVLGGVPLFGLLGVFLGPIIIALALALVRFAEEEKPAR